MGIALGYNIALPFCKRNVSTIVWLILQSGLIIYRKGIRAGKYVIDRSIDGGITWEVNLVSLLPGEDTIIIAIDNGVDGYRHEVRGDAYCIDAELTATGFDGIRGSDWENIFIIGSEYTLIKFGALYNWYAATDVRNIANTGWNVPTQTEFQTLLTYLGGFEVAGAKLKETGNIFWIEAGGTNEVGFNGRASGVRDVIPTAIFKAGLGASNLSIWTSEQRDVNDSYHLYISAYTGDVHIYYYSKKLGASIRLVRLATEAEQLLSDGTACDNYIGNDLKQYRTVKIGVQVWIADNISETKYRTGDDIPIVADAGTWVALTTGAMCYYNNDINNALM